MSRMQVLDGCRYNRCKRLRPQKCHGQMCVIAVPTKCARRLANMTPAAASTVNVDAPAVRGGRQHRQARVHGVARGNGRHEGAAQLHIAEWWETH